MIVCLCNGYSDREIKKIARDGGVQSAEDVYAALGGAFCCGACRCFADKLVAENTTASSAGMLVAAE